MVDLGCHAGHGRHKNISDALIWLDIFPGSGMVVGVDAFEDFALDLQYRFDHVPPYSEMRATTKRAFALGIGIGPIAMRQAARQSNQTTTQVNKTQKPTRL